MSVFNLLYVQSINTDYIATALTMPWLQKT